MCGFAMTLIYVIFGLLNGVFMCDWHVFDDSADWIPYIVCKEYDKVMKDSDVVKHEEKKYNLLVITNVLNYYYWIGN